MGPSSRRSSTMGESRRWSIGDPRSGPSERRLVRRAGASAYAIAGRWARGRAARPPGPDRVDCCATSAHAREGGPESGRRAGPMSTVRRLFDVRPGERVLVGLSIAYLATVVASFLLAKPIRNALFLRQYGAYRLVYVYAGVPGGALDPGAALRAVGLAPRPAPRRAGEPRLLRAQRPSRSGARSGSSICRDSRASSTSG